MCAGMGWWQENLEGPRFSLKVDLMNYFQLATPAYTEN